MRARAVLQVQRDVVRAVPQVAAEKTWSPAQWQRSQCVLFDLQRNCCSECSSDWWCSKDVVSTPSHAWSQNLLVVLQVDSVDELIQRTYRIATWGRRLHKFIVY